MLNRLFWRHRSAFTLIELLIVIAIIALLIGILLPAIGQARRNAKLVICQANQRSIGQAMFTYGAENKERLFSYSWTKGTPLPPDYYLYVKSGSITYLASDAEGGSFQFAYIMQKKLGLKDPTYFKAIDNWFPHVYYNHIPLVDHLSGVLPISVGACPEDAWLNELRKDYKNALASGLPLPQYDGGDPLQWRFPFRMSYTMHSAHYGVDKATFVNNGSQRAALIWVDDGGVHLTDGVSQFSQMPPNTYGQRRFGDVRFPSQKTFASDEFCRHYGKKAAYYADPTARQPLPFYDGSVRIYQTGETNPGWHPDKRSKMGERLSTFRPVHDYDPPMDHTVKEKGVSGYRAPAGWYQYTRGGLGGWDVPRGAQRAKINPSSGMMDATVENELDTTEGY